MSAINLGAFVAGVTVVGEFNLVDGTGAPVAATTPTLGVFPAGSGTKNVTIGTITPQRVSTIVGRYTYTFVAPAAGYYVVSFLTGSSVTGGVDLTGQNVAIFTSGTVPADIQTVKTRTVSDPGAGMSVVFPQYLQTLDSFNVTGCTGDLVANGTYFQGTSVYNGLPVFINAGGRYCYSRLSDSQWVISTAPGTESGYWWLGTLAAQSPYGLLLVHQGSAGGTAICSLPMVNAAQRAGANYKVASTTGNWATAGTWADGVVPVAGDNIVVNPGVTVTVATTLDLGTFGTLVLKGTGAINIGTSGAYSFTVQNVPEDWTIAVNYATVTNNYGKILLNSGYATVGVYTNYGTIRSNQGAVTTNEKWGTIIQNSSSGGVIAGNYGTVSVNEGTITNNYAYGVVNVNLSGVGIGTNRVGAVVNFNFGIITTNNSGGLVQWDYGTITTNSGSTNPIKIMGTAIDSVAIGAASTVPLYMPSNLPISAQQAIRAILSAVLAPNAGAGTTTETFKSIVTGQTVAVTHPDNAGTRDANGTPAYTL